MVRSVLAVLGGWMAVGVLVVVTDLVLGRLYPQSYVEGTIPPDSLSERYPEFLPWCTAAAVLPREGETVTAQLALSRGSTSARFTTRNRLVPGKFLKMHLLEGPFRSLEGRWDFIAIGDAGSRVELAIGFETQSSLAGIVLGPVFEGICNQHVDAFGRRARQVYGTR